MSRPSFLVLVSCIAALPALAADVERQRIGRERAAVTSRYQKAEAECRQRFVVTPCIDEAKAQQRKALAGLRERELVIDDADRKRRAATRSADIAEKREQAVARAVEGTAASAPARAGAPRAAMVAPSPPHAASAPREAMDGGPSQAAARAVDTAKRTQASDANRLRIEARVRKQDDAAKVDAVALKRAAPLPAPTASGPARP